MPVNLTKPVALVKRPRAGEGWTPRPWRERVDYVKVAGKHAAPYYPENERYSQARCNRVDGVATNSLDCPACSPETYPAQHTNRGGCGHVPADVRMYGQNGDVCADCWF